MPAGIYIERLVIFFTGEFLDFLFGTALNTDATAREVCAIMQNGCPDIFEFNGLSSIDECVEIFNLLEVSEPVGRIHGNNKGCRILHSAFAKNNEAHCPHLSFKPKYDEDCKLKCQLPEDSTVLDFWTQDELNFFGTYAAEQGLPAEGYIVVN
jgi:hypothetical protein